MDDEIPRFDIKQADVAPLISSLIGTAVPVNNIGQLPTKYLNTSDVSFSTESESNRESNKLMLCFLFLQEYKCKSLLNNAMQISNQFKFLQNKFKKGLFFSDYHELNERNLLSLEYDIQNAIKSKLFTRAVNRIGVQHYNSNSNLFIEIFHFRLILVNIILSLHWMELITFRRIINICYCWLSVHQ